MISRTKFKSDEIIILLGAGASVEAGIPASQGMIEKIEDLVGSKDSTWNQHKELYHYLKSSIYFADGIKGKFDGASYNVETLVNTLYELRRWEDHPLYPFVGAWNPKLLAVAGSDLRKINEFRRSIMFKLRDDWVQLVYEQKASYYEGLAAFQKAYQHPLRVFTLNYDLCVEKGCSVASVERGFNEKHQWDWRRFSSAEGEHDQKDIYLYKMHGSVDWTRDEHGFLIYFDGIFEDRPGRVGHYLRCHLQASVPRSVPVLRLRASAMDAGPGSTHHHDWLRLRRRAHKRNPQAIARQQFGEEAARRLTSLEGRKRGERRSPEGTLHDGAGHKGPKPSRLAPRQGRGLLHQPTKAPRTRETVPRERGALQRACGADSQQ